MIRTGGLMMRVGTVAAVTIAAAIVLLLVLAFLKFDQKLLNVAAARLSLVAEEVRQQSEIGLALGLELDELGDMTSVLVRAAKARDVTRINICNIQGLVLYSTDSAISSLAVDMVGFIAGSGKSYRYQVSGGEMVVALRLHDGFGRPVGDVAVHAAISDQLLSLDALRHNLLGFAGPMVISALMATLLAVVLTVRLNAGVLEQLGNEDALDGAAMKARGEGQA